MKETITKTKKEPSEWENTFANDILDKRLISKTYKEVIQFNIKKTMSIYDFSKNLLV